MGIFKKQEAVFVDKMNKLSKVTVTDDQVKFNIGYYDHSMKIDELPGLVSDLRYREAAFRHYSDKLQKEREAEAAKNNTVDDKPIDLSEIPF
jgi:hypothetical protein